MTHMELYWHFFFESEIVSILDIFPLSPNSFVLRIPLVTFLRSIVADLLAFFLLLFVASLVIYQYLPPPFWLTTAGSKLGTPITELLWHNFLLCFQIDLSSTDMKSSSRSFLYFFFLSSFFLYLPIIALCSGLFFFLGSTLPLYHEMNSKLWFLTDCFGVTSSYQTTIPEIFLGIFGVFILSAVFLHLMPSGSTASHF